MHPMYPDNKDAMPMDDEMGGGSQMEGGLGSGVEAGAGSALQDGCEKLASFPLTGEFWTRPPKHGQA